MKLKHLCFQTLKHFILFIEYASLALNELSPSNMRMRWTDSVEVCFTRVRVYEESTLIVEDVVVPI